MTLVVIDAVGLTPRALTHMPRLRRARRRGLPGPRGPRAARRDLLRAVDLPHRARADRPRDRRQRLVLPRPRRGLPVAPAQRARAGREGVGDRAAREARLQGRERLLVVRHGRLDRPHGHAAADLLRRRQEGARLLHVAAGAARPAHGRAGGVPPLHVLGPDGGHHVVALDRAGARKLLDEDELDMLLVYLPHLDYDHQRFGPAAAESAAAAAELDDVAGELVEHAQGRGDTVVVLSEYGITDARRPVDVNRALRRAGLLEVITLALILAFPTGRLDGPVERLILVWRAVGVVGLIVVMRDAGAADRRRRDDLQLQRRLPGERVPRLAAPRARRRAERRRPHPDRRAGSRDDGPDRLALRHGNAAAPARAGDRHPDRARVPRDAGRPPVRAAAGAATRDRSTRHPVVVRGRARRRLVRLPAGARRRRAVRGARAAAGRRGVAPAPVPA